ncbi:calcium-binding protein [Leisingera sp. ANG-Vp]|uniref:calcium-binding protein n=1 Tax=Leisingera sp. ANG-Vp TaxID=1577896 RepID=UPI00057D4158|nr:calcium-binding protein [Leisingera sp. ANG-Vp]KIC18861.1 hypothetical protein RA20_12790 [Leisingera sp. ANG-Vp]
MLAVILMATAGVAAAAAVIDTINDEDDIPLPPEEPEPQPEPEPEPEPEPQPEPEPEPEPEREETVRGTAGDDEIELFSGQTGFGLDGNDTLGNRYEDSVTVYGGAGDDLLHSGNHGAAAGGEGNDTIDAGFFNEVTGGSGDDLIDTAHTSEIDGGSGNDTIDANGHSTISGGSGNDVINGGWESRVAGGGGSDTLYGGRGSTLGGGAGDDEIHSWASTGARSYIYGGQGADFLTNVGNASLDGGAGNDTLSFLDTGRAGVLSGGDGADEFNIGTRGTRSFSPDDAVIIARIEDFDPEEDVLVLNTGDFIDWPVYDIVSFETRSADGDTEVLIHLPVSEDNPTGQFDTAAILLEGVRNFSADHIRLVNDGQEVEPVVGDDTDEAYSSTVSSSYYTFGGDDTVEAGGIRNVVRLGSGNDVLTATSQSLSVKAGSGDDAIVWTPAEVSDQSSDIRLGPGDDTLTASGDNLLIDSGQGSDVINLPREAGPDIEIWSEGGGAELTIGMQHKVAIYESGDQVTLNVYPEHLERGPALLELHESDITDLSVALNLPPDIDGPIEVTREYDSSEPQLERIRYTFSAQDGTDLLVLDVLADSEGVSADNVAINRNVMFE